MGSYSLKYIQANHPIKVDLGKFNKVEKMKQGLEKKQFLQYNKKGFK